MKKLIVCIFVALTCSIVEANIDYSKQYEISYKYKQRKSTRKIIREILNRKRTELQLNAPSPLKTIPYEIMPFYRKSHEGFHKRIKPMYDGIPPNRLKNLA